MTRYDYMELREKALAPDATKEASAMTQEHFYLDFNVSGPERKRLVDAIAAFTGEDAKYLGMPSFAYEVGIFRIDRAGCVSFDDRSDSELIEWLIEQLVDQGFVSLVSNLDCEEDPETDAPAPDTPDNNGHYRISVSVDSIEALERGKEI